MAWIRPVAWIRLDDDDPADVTRDRRSRLRHLACDEHAHERWNRVRGPGAVAGPGRPRPATRRRCRAQRVGEALEARRTRPAAEHIQRCPLSTPERDAAARAAVADDERAPGEE